MSTTHISGCWQPLQTNDAVQVVLGAVEGVHRLKFIEAHVIRPGAEDPAEDIYNDKLIAIAVRVERDVHYMRAFEDFLYLLGQRLPGRPLLHPPAFICCISIGHELYIDVVLGHKRQNPGG